MEWPHVHFVGESQLKTFVMAVVETASESQCNFSRLDVLFKINADLSGRFLPPVFSPLGTVRCTVPKHRKADLLE